MSSCTFYLQRQESHIWEEVSAFVYDNWEKVIITNSEGTEFPRYSGNRVSERGGKIFVDCEQGMNQQGLAIIARLFGIKNSNCPAELNGSWIQSPENVRLKLRKQVVLHDIQSGENFKPTKKPAKPVPPLAKIA